MSYGKGESQMSSTSISLAAFVFILSDSDQHRKWDSKSDRGIFLGYSTNNKAYKVYNQCTKMVMESINVIVDDYSQTTKSRLDEEDGFF